MHAGANVVFVVAVSVHPDATTELIVVQDVVAVLVLQETT